MRTHVAALAMLLLVAAGAVKADDGGECVKLQDGPKRNAPSAAPPDQS